MKILILCNNDVGLYKFRKELLQEFQNRNYEVTIVLPGGPFVPRLKKMGCRCIELEFERHGKNPFADFLLFRKYKRIIKEIRPDAVLTYTIKPNIYGGMACRLLKVPYLVNITGLGTALENPGLMQKICLFLYKIALFKAQKVFFQNTENRDFMLGHGVIKGAYDMLPGSGVNLDQYAVYPYPEGETVDFVFIARVMKEKGIDQYLDAARDIRKRHPETRFHVCGPCENPEYEKKLKELSDDGTVIYHGLVKDMGPIYRLISCTVHPTYYPEGLSNVLLESAASGRPIITTDRSGCREVVDDGVNGFVVRPKDSRNLIDKIEQFLSLSCDERKKMGLAGRAKVEREFNRNIVIRKYLDELESIEKAKN